jgi:hypothetical protein
VAAEDGLFEGETVGIHRYRILVALVVVAGGLSCARHASRASVAQKPKPTQRKVIQRATPAQLEWGPAASGLQCRLRPIKRVCPAGESPAFKADLRNQGGRVFAFLQGQQAPLDRFAIDGCWHPWPARPSVAARTLALGPGVEFPDLPATFPPNAQSYLTPGPHTIQVAFLFEGIEVVSNPVEIEIIGSR